MTNETINDPRLEEGVWTTDPESGELVPDYESTFPTIEVPRGEIDELATLLAEAQGLIETLRQGLGLVPDSLPEAL